MEPPKMNAKEVQVLETYDYYTKIYTVSECKLNMSTDAAEIEQLKKQIEMGRLNAMAARSQLENRLCPEAPIVKKPRATKKK
jgi:hypothetical protein